MNERIKALATEVGISVEYLTNTKQIVLIEKFAELIIRECAQKLEDDGMVEVAMEIKQHFGVK
jgi:hypothetical protein